VHISTLQVLCFQASDLNRSRKCFSLKTHVMADNNKRERDQRQDQGSKKEQKTSSGGGNGKNQKRDTKGMDKKSDEKDSDSKERRR
jgi:hypothetical protein